VMTRQKTPTKRAHDAAIMFFDVMTVARRDSFCFQSVTTKPSKFLPAFEKIRPAVQIMTGKPFWDYYSNTKDGSGWRDKPWASALKDVNAVFYIHAFEDAYLCQLERYEHELHKRAEENQHFPNPIGMMFQPFKMNDVVLKGSSVLVIDPKIYPSFSFYREITWKATCVVRCTLSSLANSLFPDALTPEETKDGYRVKHNDNSTRPDALGLALGMGYVAGMGERMLNADKWRVACGLRRASKENGIEVESFFTQIPRSKTEASA
jgi:hypothetical protein